MASLKPKNLHVAGSVEAARTYHQSYEGSPAEAYVAARGLGELAGTLGLGYVDSAIPGHEWYAGHLAIPYLRPAGGADGVATVRYRCIADECVKGTDGQYLFLTGEKERHDHKGGKYLSAPGDSPRLYNTSALIEPSPVMVVVEGEFDALSWEIAGLPAVGVPGTGTWRDYWTPAFLGYETVYLIAEDGPGVTFMKDLATSLPNSRVIEMTDERDSNSVLLALGPHELRKRIGK